MGGLGNLTKAAGLVVLVALPIGPASAIADEVEDGSAVFEENCNACHKLGRANNFGPNLIGVVGRQPGSYPGYRYTRSMRAFGEGKTWSEDMLFEYIELPRRMVRGTKMSFPGLKDAEKRRKVIAYLKSIGLRSASVTVE